MTTPEYQDIAEQFDKLCKMLAGEFKRRDNQIIQLGKILTDVGVCLQEKEKEIKDLQEALADIYLTGADLINNKQEG